MIVAIVAITTTTAVAITVAAKNAAGGKSSKTKIVVQNATNVAMIAVIKPTTNTVMS